ncbi:MAG TPA: hypothetical protein VGO11_19860 [Chthoniobacteraceae bacterium]|jgi:hypothetical protein|nr:hypothetical protein [Chthoniobacteraceae bacterium]
MSTYRLWVCDQESGRDIFTGEEDADHSHMKQRLAAEAFRGRDVWLIWPDGTKELPDGSTSKDGEGGADAINDLREVKASLEEMLAQRWNEACPAGTAVLYQPVLGDSRLIETVTRSEAWLMGGHSAMVMVKGISGGVSLRHVMVKVPEPASAPELFFLLSVKHSPMPGSDLALWWAPHRAGYVTDLRRAGQYTRAEIDSAWDYAIVAVPVDEGLKLSRSLVPWEMAREKFVQPVVAAP